MPLSRYSSISAYRPCGENVDGDVRKCGVKAADDLWQTGDHDAGEGGNAQDADLNALNEVRGGVELVDAGNAVADVADQERAVCRQLCAALAAVQHSHAQLLLKGLDGVACGGLRIAHGGRGPGQASKLDGLQEQTQFFHFPYTMFFLQSVARRAAGGAGKSCARIIAKFFSK